MTKMKKMLLLANGGHTKVLLKAPPYLNHAPNIGDYCACSVVAELWQQLHVLQ